MAEVPELHAAQLAAAYYGERQGGDLHDFVRVTPNRVLFGLLDMAGRLEENSAIVSAAQQTFRTRSQELFSADDVNEADAMAELCLELNRAIMAAEGGIRSCPGLCRLLQRRPGHHLLLQRRPHSRTAPRSHRHHRTRAPRACPWDFFPTPPARLPWSLCPPALLYCWFPEVCLRAGAGARNSGWSG